MDALLALGLVAAHATYLFNGYNAIRAGGTGGWLSPVIPAACSAAYLLCVTVGVRAMKGRASFPALKGSMAVYNFYSTFLSGLMLALYVRDVDWRSPFTAPFAPGAGWRAAEAVFWLNYHAKFLEYADTLFMIARGKFEQVSSLHVIHHAEMGPLSACLAPRPPAPATAALTTQHPNQYPTRTLTTTNSVVLPGALSRRKHGLRADD